MSILLNKDPEPLFNQRCTEILNQWQAGKLPFMDASQQLEDLAVQARAAGQPANEGRTEIFMGIMQGYRGNYGTAIEHFELGYKLFSMVGNQQQLLIIDLNLGESYRHKGDYTRARKYFQTAQQVALELADQVRYTMAVVNEGLMLINMDHYDSARQAFDKGIALLEAQPDEATRLASTKCEIHRGLALVYLQENNPSAAWEQALLALEAAKISQETIMFGYAYRAMAEALTDLIPPPTVAEGFPVDPDHYFRQAVESFQGVHAEGEIGRTLYKYALSLSKRGQKMPAARKLQQALMIFIKRGMTKDAAKAAEAQNEIL